MITSQSRDPNRLFPADPRTRGIARQLYERVSEAPIISPHGHVPVQWIADDIPFSDPTNLLISHDHYVTRLLHAAGVDLAVLGVGAHPAPDARLAWRTLAANWHVLEGTASSYWLSEELASVFGIDVALTPANADAVFDRISEQLVLPSFRPRALFRRFNIEVLATTDDPLDDLRHHASIAASDLPGRVLPTFRPDAYLNPEGAAFADHVRQLLSACAEPATFSGYLRALEARREHFRRHGAVSTDHGIEDPFTADLEPGEAERIFQALLRGTASAADRRVFHGHMLVEMARMSIDDGMTMTLHAGVVRNHSTATFARFGADSGHDIPARTDYVRGMRPLLERFGLDSRLRLVLFAVDETTFSREIAPLAGFYPSVYVGAPWWFLDAPDAIQRFRAAVTETAGFSRGSGFIDDTRAFLSIPARHDMARRADAGYLARLVAESRLRIEVAESLIDDIVGPQPRRVFNL